MSTETWITAAFLCVGALALAAWYASRRDERAQEIERVVEGVTVMADDAEERLTSNLPTRLTESWISRRLDENMRVFRDEQGMFERWLLTLRERYSTPWEIEILDHVEQRFRKEISIMKLAAERAAVGRTLSERTSAEIARTKTEHLAAQTAYDQAEATAPTAKQTAELEAENRRLVAELENKRLKKEIAELGKPAEPPVPPARKKSFEKRMKDDVEQQMRRIVAESWALQNVEEAAKKRLAEIVGAGYDEESDLYKDVLAQFDKQRGRIMERL